MDQQKKPGISSILVAVIGVGAILVGFGNPRVPAGAQYMPPPMTPPINPTFQPIDVTHTVQQMNAFGANVGGPTPSDGIDPAKFFPPVSKLGGPTDFILVQLENNDSSIKRDSPYAVTLLSGTVLASVKKPSQTGMIQTSVGDVAFSSNSDAFISFSNGVLRVRNVDGLGQTLKIHIKTGPLAGRTFAIQPGYELVISDHKLGRPELRPSDGILRRNAQMFGGGLAAIAQFSVQSALEHSALVSSIGHVQNNDPKDKRILSDMSRMAAVLNQLNGGQGFQR